MAQARVKGLREFQRALARCDKESAKQVRDRLRAVGEKVRAGASERLMPISPRSAATYRVVVRQRGVAVEQSRRRTTGKRPDFGTLQLTRAMVPALEANEQETMDELERALDEIEAIFERG